MPTAQAFAIACDDFRIQKPIQEFFENQLNLYAVDLNTELGGVKEIFEGGTKREWIFETLRASIDQHQISRIILINHTDCSAYGSIDSFPNPDEEIHLHEIQLRHAVSDVKAKFPDKEVEAYLTIISRVDEPTTFKKVI